MPLSAGDKLGPYEIVAPLGAGGMGEVYRARDAKLHRDVAIKVLPASLANDAQYMARFEREAQMLAALNHPNIATVYGIEQGALVMELVEGADLKGPLPLDEALAIARQIASGLEAAHERGIIHRDLKPANIKLTPAGVVKILDFGLAKAAGEASAAAGSNASMSPTLSMEMTRAGMILGTVAYMSPEQARGKVVDKRTDIWAFGVVLYEIVTGQRLFEGDDLTETLASVVKDKPDLSAVPAKVRRLLERCLEKDPKKRLRDIGDMELPLEDAAPSRPANRPYQSRVAWGVAAAALAGVGFLGWREWSAPTAADSPLTRLSVDLGPLAEPDARVSAILSPDGRRIVFTGRAESGLKQLYTRRLDQPAATLLVASASINFEPFFSPDGKWVGFWSYDEKIMKVSAQGGAAVVVGASPRTALGVLGASWGDDGNIIIGTMNGLWRMPASGGKARILHEGSGHQFFPQVLPGAKAVLFNSDPATGNLEDCDIATLRFDNGEKKTLLHGGYWPRYLPTSGETGHLVYIHEGILFGVGFDPRKLELLGTPTQLLDDVAANTAVNDGGGQFAYSNTGTLVYLSGKAQGNSFPISWLDASGRVTPLVPQAAPYAAPRLSPDGKRLAYAASGNNGYDVWVYDLDRGTPTQLTFEGAANHEVAWARDSKHLVYEDGATMWWIRADGAGKPQALLEKADNPRPFSFAPDGRLAFSRNETGLPDIWTLPIDLTDPEHPKPGKAEPFVADPAIVEVDPAFSPEGKFLAYCSSESGAEQVFVRPFPGPGGKWKISTAGGKFPAWLAATHEILFLGGDNHIMAVDYTIQGDSFSSGKPRAWSPTQVRKMNVQQNFDVAADGKRVVMFPRAVGADSPGSLRATFLLNFFDEVRRRVPSGK